MTALAVSAAADAINLGRYRKDGGINFIRRAATVEKRTARGNVLHLFSASAIPGSAHFVTMPSLAWSFERSLINQREHGKGRAYPRRTLITALERSRPTYTASVLLMPGLHDGLVQLIPPEWADAALRTRAISRFFLTTLERYAHRVVVGDTWAARGCNGAWLDFTGQLSLNRISAIGALWRQTDHTMVVTSLAARWDKATSEAIHGAGSIAEVLAMACEGATVHSVYRYCDTVPMVQVALVRTDAANSPVMKRRLR